MYYLELRALEINAVLCSHHVLRLTGALNSNEAALEKEKFKGLLGVEGQG